jgi:Uma2 family endonuclease
MSVDPTVEPTTPAQDPADLLNVIEEASHEPIRPQYVEGTIMVPPQPDHQHNKCAFEVPFQLRMAGFDLAGTGNGYRSGLSAGKTLALVIPDFYVLRREPSDLDEAYRKAHQGWYPMDLLALAGEVTSSNHETDTGPKLRTYAAAGVPVYVLLNREDGRAYAYSEPVAASEEVRRSHYAAVASVELGGKLQLPAPYPILDTGFLSAP